MHAHLVPRFEDEADLGGMHQLVARARPFSAFTLVLGRMAPGGVFEPAHAMVLKGRDELTVPLNIEALPSAREFQDSIQVRSLSHTLRRHQQQRRIARPRIRC